MSVHEVKWIRRNEDVPHHERIQAIGGIYANGTVWRLSREEAIREIEEGNQRFYVQIEASKIHVIVAISPQGVKYLKTDVSHGQLCRLLSLFEMHLNNSPSSLPSKATAS